MSKKIKIPSNNIKYRLVDLFHNFLDNHYKSMQHKRSSYPYGFDYDDDDDEEMYYLMNQGYMFPYIDEDYMDEDGYGVLWPNTSSNKRKKSKHRKHNKSSRKRARLIDINQPYSGEEEYPREVDDDDIMFTEYEELEDNGLTNGKEIYYYVDYHDKENRLEFSSLDSFIEFCDDNGYNIPEKVLNEIKYRRVSHVCLNPLVRGYGYYEIIAEESYGSLFYEVCESSELS